MNIEIGNKYTTSEGETITLVEVGIDSEVCIKHDDGKLGLVDVATLHSQAEPHLVFTTKSVACNLATKIAWLEGLSVLSECTGEQYCEVLTPTGHVKYDPIGRPAIIQQLIQKYKIDLDWRENNSCGLSIYDPSLSDRLAQESTEDHHGCFATTVLSAILEAQIPC